MKKLEELVPSADLGHFRLHKHGDQTDPANESSLALLKSKHNSECRFCTFLSSKHQEVDHIDGNHKRNVAENLDVVCPLCHGVKHLPISALSDSVRVAYVPELNQVQIHQLILVTWFATESCERAISENPSFSREKICKLRDVGARAESLYQQFDQRCKLVASFLNSGLGADTLRRNGFESKNHPGLKADEHINAGLLANVLSRLAENEPQRYQDRGALLGGLRIIPWKKHFLRDRTSSAGQRFVHWLDEHHNVNPLHCWGDVLEPTSKPLEEVLFDFVIDADTAVRQYKDALSRQK